MTRLSDSEIQLDDTLLESVTGGNLNPPRERVGAVVGNNPIYGQNYMVDVVGDPFKEAARIRQRVDNAISNLPDWR